MATDIRHGMSGLAYFRKMIAGEVEPPPLIRLLGMQLAEADEGRVVFTATVRPEHYNGMGVAHGGFAATLLDSALGCCINTLMPPGRRFTTLELKINLTRPLTTEAGRPGVTSRVWEELPYTIGLPPRSRMLPGLRTGSCEKLPPTMCLGGTQPSSSPREYSTFIASGTCLSSWL